MPAASTIHARTHPPLRPRAGRTFTASMPLPLITSTVRVTRRLPHVYRPAHTAASFASSTFPRATPALIGRAGRFTLGLLTWLPIWIFVRNHVVNTFSVNGSSMQPLLSPDFSATGERDEVLASMWQPAVGLERGMIVAFCTPHDPERTSIKRVVALEGDVVRPRNPAYPGVCEVVVPAGHVWVEGSDGFRSIDSNDFGPLSMSLVVARATHIVWPLARMGPIPWQEWRGDARVTVRDVQRPLLWDE